MTTSALAPWGKPVFSARHQPRESRFWRKLLRSSEAHRIDLGRAWHGLPEAHRQILLYGDSQGFEGTTPSLQRLYTETESEFFRSEIEKYMTERPCPACDGSRLKPEALSVRLAGSNIHQFCTRSVREALAWMEQLQLSDRQQTIAHQVIREIHARLKFLNDVGLD